MNTQNNYAQIIHELLTQKRETNPDYSLRAFAREVDIEQSNLSKILKGKRKLTASHVTRISNKFNLPSETTLRLFESISPS